jgi:hypothetical protein
LEVAEASGDHALTGDVRAHLENYEREQPIREGVEAPH